MNTIRQSKTLLAIFALLLIFGACKGESPTAPPTGGGGNPPGGGGTTPPPAGVQLTLTTSNSEPLVDSTVTVTATVTQDGQPVPNGTAVEFSTTAGGLNGTQATSIIRTTTNGVASVTLTSSAAGPARITAVVSNVLRTVDVTFQARPIVIPPVSKVPVIERIEPALGRPAGGQTIRIIGRNFEGPVRVLFDVGGATPVEGFIISVSPTAIEVVTPGVNLGAGQQLLADIIVFTQVGTASEQRVESEGAFTYRNEQLTPRISTATPNSGPVVGGTIVEIFGDGFQAPVQVLFGAAEARVISVEYDRIRVEAPAGRDTSENGSGVVTGPVAITVRNIESQTFATLAGGFRYVSAVAITGVTVQGSLGDPGGARVTIEGIGFVGPVIVVVRTQEGDIGLQPISVSGTRIVALTPDLSGFPCTDDPLEGPIVVTNLVNGDQAEGPTFRFAVPPSAIVSISPQAVEAGDDVVVTVVNARPGANRISIGDRVLFPSAVTFDESTRVATFRVATPMNVTFPTEACVSGGITGTRQVPVNLDVTYANPGADCSDTAAGAVTILPENANCVLPAAPEVNLAIPVPPSCADVGNVVAAGTVTGTATITFNNSGGQPLNVSRTSVSGAGFSVAPSSVTIAPGQSGSFTVTFDPAAVGAVEGTATFNTNDADEGTINVCLSGNGT